MPFNCKRDSMFLFFIWVSIVISSLYPRVVTAQQVIEVLQEHQETTLFSSFIEKTQLNEQLSNNGPYTIFVPSNSALQSFEDQLNRSDSSDLRNFILNHVITGMATKRHLSVMSNAPSLGGLVLQMTVQQGDNVMINDVGISQFNIRAENGVIHIIDGTLEN